MAKEYQDPILLKIIEVLEKHGPAELKGRYGTSDPGIIGKNELNKPLVFVTYEKQGIADASAGELESKLSININIVCDMTEDFGQGLNASAHMRAMALAVGRDPETFRISSNSIVGVLRAKQELADNLWLEVGSETEIVPDAVNRNKGLVTSEVLITATVTFQELMPEVIE